MIIEQNSDDTNGIDKTGLKNTEEGNRTTILMFDTLTEFSCILNFLNV